jgi:hypothetical protein
MQLYFLIAAGKLRMVERDFHRALADFRSLGAISTRTRVVPWRSLAALCLRELDESEAGSSSPRSSSTPAAGGRRAVGVALRVLGLLVEGGKRGIQLLAESAETLDSDAGATRAGPVARRARGRAAPVTTGGRTLASTSADGLELAHLSGACLLEGAGTGQLAATGAAETGDPDRCRDADRQRAPRRPDGRAGLSNKEIAQTLFVTVKTVELHLSNVPQAPDRLAARGLRSVAA